MKYGETLRQRSIPAWSHHNIDYDDVKHFIKEHTTPGKGKTISVPGRGDDKLAEVETALFHILADQHQRINLFVKSKAGEIQRRLDHSKKQLQQLASRQSTTTDTRIPVSRLERYGRLENDVVKAGDEIRSLARFTATQRTAFRKLLKKYKKWTGSTELEDRFRDEILDDSESFTNLDLGLLLDDYSATQQSIRALYEDQLHRSRAVDRNAVSDTTATSSSTIKQLQDAVETRLRVFFDASIATVPLGENGTFASYFVHPDNIVELQMLLLQYARFYHSRSRSNSIATPVTSESPTASAFRNPRTEDADYHTLVADNMEHFAQELSSLTVDSREHLPGALPQRARASVRWNNDEHALACLRSRSGQTKSAFLKKKHTADFFDKTAEFSPRNDSGLPDSVENIEDLRRELLKDEIKPLYKYSSCRSRLSGLEDSAESLLLATLDTGISIETRGTQDNSKSTFPFALLLIRQEGLPKTDFLSTLDRSHLVERVRGFSIEYHAIWQTHRPTSIPPPFWLPMLSQDIRKLPPPMMKRSSIAAGSSSGAQTVASGESITGGTDSTTAVEQELPQQLDAPPLKSFRKKKKRRANDDENARQQRYWSEYDHPEDGGSDQDAYVIYIDPNEKSVLDHFFEKLTALFRRKSDEKNIAWSTPVSPHDDDVSSDDEETALTSFKNSTSFGTFTHSSSRAQDNVYRSEEYSGLSHFSGTCFAASLAILVMAYILHSTGRKTFHREVHYGVLFAMICSLAFMLVGLMSVLRSQRSLSCTAWITSIATLLIDVVASGGLIVWMLG